MGTQRIRTRSFAAWFTIAIVLTGCLTSDDTEEVSPSNPPPGENQPPVIAGTPSQVVKAGVNYSFTPTATDPDNDTLEFSIANRPDWANFDTGNGRLAGIPPLESEGVYLDIVIAVSDGSTSASLPAFMISVEPATVPNMPPEISGVPPTSATSGNTYSFTPSAFDPDGDPLAFSIQNRPAWASFDAATGALTGTPSLGDVGTYSGIVIAVSDADSSTSLPAFDIVVNQFSLGSALLTWTPPTENTDGSPLVDLASYRVYYGTNQDHLNMQIDLPNPGLSSYVVENLTPATYYFVITAINSIGLESDASNMVSKTID